MYKKQITNYTDQELITLLVREKDKESMKAAISRKTLAEFIYNTDVEELSSIKGIGPVTSIRIAAFQEVIRRVSRQKHECVKCLISSPKDVCSLMLPVVGHLRHEEFHVIYVDQKNQVLNVQMISKGGLSATVVDPVLVFKPAVKSGGVAAIIAVHNHPSNICHPSSEDIVLTARLRDAGELLGIRLLDHIIVGNSNYHSMKEHAQF